ncbi:methylated-DNA--[protein]-cysteine S-methyltransferase [Curtobacterium caseinilyticum]|uniref:Methylated-DNA--[protein]-cysteine S-methyltransferase n=1 Tax=Curtobacterium caseinilyticum TaxID=3055137 RepID=A0ABT7TSS2_9MICO|nr:methylated-DNA--[protein]-cysteine S-methyltransferase [Curtobacterium caseinilyticum]MDM7892560.1 methylated-DNA--[protein]-cysteine S-methyltransferase [Curtobacterium caseinilyticum]
MTGATTRTMLDGTPTATMQTLDTPDGPFTVLEDTEGRVLASGWTDDTARLLARLADRHRPEHVTVGRVAAAEAVDAYYAGEVEHAMQVPVRQHGTELFTEGWQQLRAIPAGTVLTYTELAAAMGRPDAVRAAASVCARNAPALFVPCHRVLRSDGTLGGFAWGLDVKRSLLERESVGVTALV